MMIRVLLIASSLVVYGCQGRKTEGAHSPNETPEPGWQHVKDCAFQAEHEFMAEGNRRDTPGTTYIANFESHYNERLKTCFVLFNVMDARSAATGIWTWHYLNDAFDRKEYGVYGWRSDKVKKFWEVAPTECHVLDASGAKVFCTSEDEFQSLIKTYMEDQTVGKKAGK